MTKSGIIWAIAIIAVVCLALTLSYDLIIVNTAHKKPLYCEHTETNKSILSPHTIKSFLGKQVVINDSVIEQISVIAKQDKNLSYSDSIIKICNVEWRINLRPTMIVLFTSINPDEPQMKQVVNYLNGIYGNPYRDEEDRYRFRWPSNPYKYTIRGFSGPGSSVQLRRVHSEEGGTFLMFL